MKTKKTFSPKDGEVDFKDIDKQMLESFECNQFDSENKKFLSMIREQTNSAINNKKYFIYNNNLKSSKNRQTQIFYWKFIIRNEFYCFSSRLDFIV